MKIGELPNFKDKPEAFALRGDELVSTAVKTMAEKNIGSVVIVDEAQKVRGIVTERDLLRRLLGANLDQNTTPLSAIMSSNPQVAGLDDEDVEWLRSMSEKRFRHLPVVDDDGRLVNILSQGDFVSRSWPELLVMFRSKASNSLQGPSAPLPILFGGLMIYSLLMIAIMKFL